MPLDGMSQRIKTYSDLRNILHQNGVAANHMSSAISKVASQNNIDNIYELNEEKKVNIDGSIFLQYAIPPLQENKNIFEEQNSSLKVYETNLSKIKDDSLEPIETYNDDDYEVVDYDNYYNFGQAANNEENQASKPVSPLAEDTKVDFETFKNKYSDGLVTNTVSDANKDEQLYNIFNRFDTNSDSYLDKTELDNARALSMHGQNKELEKTDNFSQEGEETLGGDMSMQMDMSNDSSNPQ